MKKVFLIVLLFILFAFNANAALHRIYTNTGSAAISASCSVYNIIIVKQVTIHFSSAPTTSENLVFTLDSDAGAAYDTVLYSSDPSASSMTDLVWIPDDGALVLMLDDTLDITYTNTDTRTIGISVYYELVQ